MMLFQPVTLDGRPSALKLIDAASKDEITEQEYFLKAREIYNARNPHAAVGGDVNRLRRSGEVTQERSIRVTSGWNRIGNTTQREDHRH